MSNARDLFDVSGTSFKGEAKGSADKFDPNPKKTQSGTYKAIIRFVPYLHDIKKSMITDKKMCWLTDISTGQSRYINTLTHLGKNCPLYKTYWDLKNSDDASLKSKAQFFSSNSKYVSLVQILKDDQNSDNVGKILLWDFGYKIKEKYDAEEAPTVGKARNPIDIFIGRPFWVETYVFGDQVNYDRCKFLSKEDYEDLQIPLHLGANKLPIDVNDEKDLATYAEYLKAESPDITKESPRPWTQEEEDFVNSAISAAYNNSGTGQIQSSVTIAERGKVQMSPGKSSKNDDLLEDIDLDDDISADLQRSKNKSKTKSAPESDDLLDDVDIDLDELDDL